MLGLEGLHDAGAMVVAVLVEAIVLHVGYGLLVRRFGDSVTDTLGAD